MGVLIGLLLSVNSVFLSPLQNYLNSGVRHESVSGGSYRRVGFPESAYDADKLYSGLANVVIDGDLSDQQNTEFALAMFRTPNTDEFDTVLCLFSIHYPWGGGGLGYHLHYHCIGHVDDDRNTVMLDNGNTLHFNDSATNFTGDYHFRQNESDIRLYNIEVCQLSTEGYGEGTVEVRSL